ncbi:MAG: hypothetical protein GY816_12105 [Cytophagales bacterium]|nr:hypothetical protein [Cytophagales bacterium]
MEKRSTWSRKKGVPSQTSTEQKKKASGKTKKLEALSKKCTKELASAKNTIEQLGFIEPSTQDKFLNYIDEFPHNVYCLWFFIPLTLFSYFKATNDVAKWGKYDGSPTK